MTTCLEVARKIDVGVATAKSLSVTRPRVHLVRFASA